MLSHICKNIAMGVLEKKYGDCNVEWQFMMANYAILEFCGI